MGYAGLRIGEVEQLRKQDIDVKNKRITMIHICRGGSNGTIKDREGRFVPIHPTVANLMPLKTTGMAGCFLTSKPEIN